MKSDVLIVLGSPNSPTGNLSSISTSRLNYCLNHFKQGNLILCTGGWGVQFNTSENSHASYAKQYLLENGISENCILEAALSSNTVDDAVKIKPILSKLKNIKLTIVTSDYHIARVKLIFKEILKIYPMEFIGVESNLEQEEYNLLVRHEKKAIAAIQKNGLYY
ncbi:YdcF family protein [Bacteroidota bacterium]